jgi:hypothetical protein
MRLIGSGAARLALKPRVDRMLARGHSSDGP